jgi:hypothetical protein
VGKIVGLTQGKDGCVTVQEINISAVGVSKKLRRSSTVGYKFSFRLSYPYPPLQMGAVLNSSANNAMAS